MRLFSSFHNDCRYEHGGLSQGVELPQQVVPFPHFGEAPAASFGMLGAEIRRSSCVAPQCLQAKDSSSRLVLIRTSVVRPHFKQRKSYMGMLNTSFDLFKFHDLTTGIVPVLLHGPCAPQDRERSRQERAHSSIHILPRIDEPCGFFYQNVPGFLFDLFFLIISGSS